MARWAALPIVAVVASYIAFGFIALVGGNPSRGTLYIAAIPAMALIILVSAGLAPSHKRIVAILSFALVAAFAVKIVPYPNIGLPFGYWVYPNRAMKAALECPNVQSAKLSWANYDSTLEEFGIEVTSVKKNSGTTIRIISFPQYPTHEELAIGLATIGCEA
jgi:hypothetical protein